MELTILMPCLNEAETLAACIAKAKNFLDTYKIDGEILIADNGSDDRSVEIARSMGVRVIHVAKKGYGSALTAGCKSAGGGYVIMGDADDSYDFSDLMPFLEKLREGYELVMGNRFAGGIEKGAMPLLHRYLGNPVLSFIGRLFYKSKIGDFHCGLRGYNRESIMKLHLKTTGMEYASEMVVMSELAGLKITEVPTTLKKDGRSRAPHLRSFQDGWRHLKFLFMYSPKWLFLYPGIFLSVLGLTGELIIAFAGNVRIGAVTIGIHTMLYCMLFFILGLNIIFIYIFTKVYAEQSHFIPQKDKTINYLVNFSIDAGIFSGTIMTLFGTAGSIAAVLLWKNTRYGPLVPENIMRMVIPAVTLIAVGVEFIFASFFIGILKIDQKEQ